MDVALEFVLHVATEVDKLFKHSVIQLANLPVEVPFNTFFNQVKYPGGLTWVERFFFYSELVTVTRLGN
jgi:hypothetical protein